MVVTVLLNDVVVFRATETVCVPLTDPGADGCVKLSAVPATVIVANVAVANMFVPAPCRPAPQLSV